MEWHGASASDVLKELSSTDSGLSSEEAATRLEKYGRNKLPEKGGVEPLRIFLNQFTSILVIILVVAALISAAIGEALDAAAIAAILVLNAVLGFVQEYRAERSLDALKRLVKKTAKVLRNGVKQEIPTDELVPGDIIYLEAGDKIPADARVIYASSLKTQESALTGESIPVDKRTDALKGELALPERKNMVYMGTDVVYGAGRAVVVSTGSQTELGKIASLVQAKKEQLPLQIKMEEISKKLGIGTLAVVAVVVLTGLIKNYPITLEKIRIMFIQGISLAVAAIPEGLPAVVTIALAIGVQRMVKRNTIIRKLPAVETLGSVSVICSDKTGTLTQNKMTVRKAITEFEFDITGDGYEPKGEFLYKGKPIKAEQSETLRVMLRTAVLCNNADLITNEWRVVGDPTEGCLITAAGKAGVSKRQLEQQYVRVGEIPFDSDRKAMSTVNKTAGGLALYTKGAPEVILEKCDRILMEGRIRRISSTDKKRILEANARMAANALRVLAFAFREIEPKKQYTPEDEKDLIFLGIMGMIDDARPEVKEAVARAKDAGIRTIMITGDNALTAKAIAKEIGIEGEVIEGRTLEKMSAEELATKIDEVSIFARISPLMKVKIVDALKKKDHVVAMTGDGVNDAPALKKSDVGIAMGITGTDVAREAADAVLVDDNYASIVDAVEEGRGVYDNTQKFVNYLLSSNIAEVMIVFLAILLTPFVPMTAIQLLWINVATDGLPAIALGVDPPEKDIMKRKPRPKNAEILDRKTVIYYLILGTTITIGTLFAFFLYLPRGLIYAQTMVFTIIVMFELFNVFNCRTRKSIFVDQPFRNKWLLLAVALSLVLQLVILYTPALDSIFDVVPLTAADWISIIAVASTVIVASEIGKKILFK